MSEFKLIKKTKNIGFDDLRIPLEEGLTPEQENEYYSTPFKKRDIRNYYDVVYKYEGKIKILYEIDHQKRSQKCICGTPIRYEYQVINKISGKYYSIGCVCIKKCEKWYTEYKTLIDNVKQKCLHCKKGNLRKNMKLHKKCQKKYGEKIDKYLMSWALAFNKIATRSEKVNIKKI